MLGGGLRVSTPTRAGGPPPPTDAYGVTLTLDVPRDARSVPMTRRLVRHALGDVGVLPDIAGLRTRYPDFIVAAIGATRP